MTIVSSTASHAPCTQPHREPWLAESCHTLSYLAAPAAALKRTGLEEGKEQEDNGVLS